MRCAIFIKAGAASRATFPSHACTWKELCLDRERPLVATAPDSESNSAIRRATFATCISLFVACAAHADEQRVVYAATDPYQGQLRIRVSSGTSIVADKQADRLYVSSATGTVTEVSFEQAAATIIQDAQARAHVISQFRASLNDTGHLVTVTSPRLATDSRIWVTPPKMCGEHVCLIEESVESRPVVDLDGPSSCNHYLCPRLPLPCDLGPCSPNRWTYDQMFYTGFNAGWGNNAGGGSIPQQELISYDKERFEQSRAGACTEKTVKAAGTVGAGAGVAGACVGTVTGAGAVLCAGAILAYGVGLYETSRAAKQCHAAYPGIGRW